MVDRELALGLNLSTSPLNQPRGTYRYASNVVTDKANRGSVTNERAYIKYKEIRGNIIGSCFITPSEQVLFTDANYIYLLNTDNDSVISYLIPNANFSSSIVAESRVVNGCDRIVYFVDGVNPRRYFNFDSIESFKTNNIFDTKKFELNRTFKPPIIKTEIINSGGSLRYGVYNFIVEYLDENENVLYTSPVDINYTPIGLNDNKGALNGDTNSAEAGGRPESNKSIRVLVSNIDGANYARLVVLRTTTSDGFTSDAHIVGQVIDIEGSEFEFVYTGFNVDAGDFTVNKNQYLVNNALYKTAVTQEQVQDRLLQANVSEVTVDSFEFQSYANQIVTKWVARKEAPNYQSRTRLGGDKKALGIVYIMEDNSYSNVHPIFPTQTPNKPISNYELTVGYTNVPPIDSNGLFTITYQIGNSDPITTTDTISVITSDRSVLIAESEEEIKVLSFEASSPVLEYNLTISEISKIEATIDAVPINGTYASGLTGAEESVQVLNEPVNAACKDINYWGSYSGQKVKYHLLPDRSQLPIYEDGDVINLGFLFENVIYPEGVIGHFFVEATVSNIEAKGILTAFEDADITNNRGSYFHLYDGEIPRPLSKFGNLISPSFIYNKEYITGNKLKVEGVWNYNFNDLGTTNYAADDDQPYNSIEIDVRQYVPTNYITDSGIFYNIKNSIVLQPSSFFNGVVNKSVSNPFNVLEFTKDLSFDLSRLIRYVTVYNNTGKFSNLYSLSFRRITEYKENVSFAGDAFITPLQLSNVVEQRYENANLGKDKIYIDSEVLEKLYVESKINTHLLHDGTDICSTHYPVGESPFSDIVELVTTGVSSGKRIIRSQICPLWDGYNKDYSRISNFNIYGLNSRTYNYCSDCQGSFPTRIIYSERSFQETLQDNYRSFKANNYVDLPANKGSIQGMDYKNGQLWVRTQHSCFVVTPNPQQLQLQGTTVEIGTGDFLSLPEQELNAVDIGYGGQLHPHESINTEHGLIWIDRSRGKVLRVADKLEEISRKGMFDYFLNYLDVTDHIRLGYDPIHERLLMTNLEKNITISYCFESQMWKSFHSYKPNYYLFNKDTLYSFYNNDTFIYSHTSNEYLDSTVEVFIKDSNPFTLDTVSYYAKHYDNETLTNNTFNAALLYNTNQCSGYKTITNTPYRTYKVDTVSITKKNNLCRLSAFRDIAVGTPVLDEDQTANVDINTPQINQRKFNDRWIAIRLLDSSKDKYVLDYIETLKYYIEPNEFNSKNQLG